MKSILFALMLIAIGAWIWLSNFGILSFVWARDWPVIIIAIGICTILDVLFNKRKRS